ncbi:hypothetical protein Ahy_A09g045644 [Arachis hypogaea]|uniref:Aminotransferase-like plant mobile domain-containing protein n=1 Tax=Arachis hypogaea TaxID=3818 RepID=A0A445BMV1_ARAHY|nr:hypothetical protein Ahy_A09g045644 [Arachis hypogaea]
MVRKLDLPQTDAEPLDIEQSIKRYVRCQIFCLLGSTLFTDKSTAYAHVKYLLLLRDFEWIHTYSWGQHDSHIFTGHYAMYDGVILRRWMTLLICCLFGHGSDCLESFQTDDSMLSKTAATFRQKIDYINKWRPYEELIIPNELLRHLKVCDIIALLLSFECVEWHPANRVMIIVA